MIWLKSVEYIFPTENELMPGILFCFLSTEIYLYCGVDFRAVEDRIELDQK